MRPRLFAIAGVALLLAACAGDAPTRATAGLAIACDSIGTMLTELAPMRAAGELSDSQIQRITGIRDATEPYCAPDSIVDPAAVVAFVQTSAGQLRFIFEGG